MVPFWLTRWASVAGDPSVRLKNGSAQDDAQFLTNLRFSLGRPLAPPVKARGFGMTPSREYVGRREPLHRVGLLFRHVADDGQLIHLVLVGFQKKDDPED